MWRRRGRCEVEEVGVEGKWREVNRKSREGVEIN